MVDSIYSMDFAILDFIREHITCRFLDVFLGIFTTLGNAGIVWIAVALAMLCTKKHRLLGIKLAAALIICLLVGNLGLKPLVARPRPFLINTAVIPTISPPSGFSFPSGHTFSAFASSTVMLLDRPRYTKAGVICIISAVIIAFSRLYFYVHYPTDVLVGVIMGAAAAFAVHNIFKAVMRRRSTETDTDKNLSSQD